MNARDHLEQLRKDIAANPDSLAAAKARQNDVFAAAITFAGSLRTYRSGSVATRFTNHPVRSCPRHYCAPATNTKARKPGTSVPGLCRFQTP